MWSNLCDVQQSDLWTNLNFWFIVFCARCALDVSMRKILFQCAIYMQDLCKIVLMSPMRNICARLYLFPNAQYMRKIVLISTMGNICARFAQDCTYSPNAQYMHKICARLYFSPQCTIYAQDCRHYWKNNNKLLSKRR